jgi:hypothetical protein
MVVLDWVRRDAMVLRMFVCSMSTDSRTRRLTLDTPFAAAAAALLEAAEAVGAGAEVGAEAGAEAEAEAGA